MRTTRSALLSLPNFSTLILCTLIFSTLSFAAAPDRIAGPVVSSQLIKLSAGVPLKAQPQYDPKLYSYPGSRYQPNLCFAEDQNIKSSATSPLTEFVAMLYFVV